MTYQYDDGGREAAGYKGQAGDCVARAIAIAAERPYCEVYDRLAAGTATERVTKHRGSSGKRTARSGIHVSRKWFKEYMAELGFVWTPTMSIGSGTTVHLRAGELPNPGRLVVSCSAHMTAVIDGQIRDTYDPSRGGTRCVYGYWTPKA